MPIGRVLSSRHSYATFLVVSKSLASPAMLECRSMLGGKLYAGRVAVSCGFLLQSWQQDSLPSRHQLQGGKYA